MTGFLEYAKGQERDLNSLTGIMIYPDSMEIPIDVIFIPLNTVNIPLDTILLKVLKDAISPAYVIYFQGMRWHEPDLQGELEKGKHVTGVLDADKYNFKKVKIKWCTIIFDRTYIDQLDVDDTEEIIEGHLTVHEQVYPFKFIDAPKKLGVPKLFKSGTAGFQL